MIFSKERKEQLALGHILAVDPGNAYAKWFNAAGEFCKMPAFIGRLTEKQFKDEMMRKDSLIVEYAGVSYLIGDRAKSLGMDPLFIAEKSEYAHIFIFGIIATSGYTKPLAPCIKELRILVEEHQSIKHWGKMTALLEAGNHSVVVNGKQYSIQIQKVKLISEGLPPYIWAMHNRIFRNPNRAQGVMDFGGGRLTMRKVDNEGIDWRKSTTKDGINELAQDIAHNLKDVYQLDVTPDEATIMAAMEQGLTETRLIAAKELKGYSENAFNYSESGHNYNFMAIYETCRRDYMAKHAKYAMNHMWKSTQFGEVLLVGGGAYYADILEEFTHGRFKIVRHDAFPNFAQVINAYSMSAY